MPAPSQPGDRGKIVTVVNPQGMVKIFTDASWREVSDREWQLGQTWHLDAGQILRAVGPGTDCMTDVPGDLPANYSITHLSTGPLVTGSFEASFASDGLHPGAAGIVAGFDGHHPRSFMALIVDALAPRQRSVRITLMVVREGKVAAMKSVNVPDPDSAPSWTLRVDTYPDGFVAFVQGRQMLVGNGERPVGAGYFGVIQLGSTYCKAMDIRFSKEAPARSSDSQKEAAMKETEPARADEAGSNLGCVIGFIKWLITMLPAGLAQTVVALILGMILIALGKFVLAFEPMHIFVPTDKMLIEVEEYQKMREKTIRKENTLL